MKKLFTVFAIATTLITLPLTVFAEANVIPSFKDFKMVPTSDNTLEVTHGKNKILIEVMAKNKYKINGMPFVWKSTDTLETAVNKLKRAYKASKKRSAFLDSLIMNEADAAIRPLFAALFGGLLGFGIADTRCNRRQRRASAPTQPVAQ